MDKNNSLQDDVLVTDESMIETNTLIVEDEALRYGFIQLPKQVLLAKNLSRDAKLLYAVLLNYAWQKESCFPGYERLSEDLQATRKSIRGYMKELEATGLLTQKRRGQGKTNLYTLKSLRTRKRPVSSDGEKLPIKKVKELPIKMVEKLPTNNKQSNKNKNNNNNNSDETLNQIGVVDVVASLLSKKISKKVAQDLARKFPADYILEKIDILDVLIESHDPNAPTSPAGWLRKAIEDDYAPPDWYKTKAEREAAQIAQKRLQEQEAAEAEREREAERHKCEQWRSMLIERHRVSQKHLTLWAQTVSQVQEITVQENLKRWLGKTLLISQKNGTATIAVPYEYASQQMSNSALEECQEILGQAVGRPVDLRLEVIPYPDSG